MLFAAATFSALGVAVAARFTSTTVFPVVSNAVLLPMFFLSGALYPLQSAPHWMQIAGHFDPVAYAVDLMRGALLGSISSSTPVLSIAVLPSVVAALAVGGRPGVQPGRGRFQPGGGPLPLAPLDG